MKDVIERRVRNDEILTADLSTLDAEFAHLTSAKRRMKS